MPDVRWLQACIGRVSSHIQVVTQVDATLVIRVLESPIVRSQIEAHLPIDKIDTLLIPFKPLKVELVPLLLVHLRKLLLHFVRIFAPKRVLIVDAGNGQAREPGLVHGEQEDLGHEFGLLLLALLDDGRLHFEVVHVALVARDIGEQKDVSCAGLVQVWGHFELESAAFLHAKRRLALHGGNLADVGLEDTLGRSVFLWFLRGRC